jgi:putative ABC transport system permease protein
MMGTLVQDIRYALVMIARARGVTIAAILTLALGIGGTTAVFCVAYGVLWKPLPYSAPDRLVRVWEEHPGGVSPAGNRWLSSHTYAVWKEHSSTLSGLGGFSILDYAVVFDDGPVKMFGSRVSPSVFEMLGVAPANGRFFHSTEGTPGTSPVVILSHVLWRDRFGSDPHVLGRSLRIDGEPHAIIGIAKPGFDFPDSRVRFWIPYALDAVASSDRTMAFTALGRLQAGATPQQAEAEGTAAARVAPRHPLVEFFFGKGGPVVVHVRPLVDDMTVNVRPALLVLLAAVGLVLLISCANVANLMLVRGVTRRRELAVRTALGGSRMRIFRQLLTESLVLATAGGLLGLLLAWWVVRIIPAVAPPGLPRLDELRLDPGILTFCVMATIAAVIVSGVLPAVRGARQIESGVLRDDLRTSSQGWRARRLSAAVLLVEAAFSTVLAIAAGLLVHSFVRLIQVDPGYTSDRVLTASIELPTGSGAERTAQFVDALLVRVRARPDVASAGGGNMIPLMRRSAVGAFTVPAQIAADKPASGRALIYTVTAGYIETLGIQLREGRLFNDTDGRDGRRVALVNEEFVRQHTAVAPVAGTRIGGLLTRDTELETEIIGVIGNVLKDGNDREPQPEIYLPHRTHNQEMVGAVQVVVRTTGSPAALAPELRGIVRNLEPAAVIDRVEPLTTTIAASVEQPRFAAAVLSGFAALGLLLAAIGLHGVLSYGVSNRRRELGVRAALGARPSALVRLVLREGLLVTIAGIAIGLVTTAVLARSAEWLLFGIRPLDPVSLAVGPVVLMMVAIVACLRPAVQAASTDPALILRGE